MKISHLGLIFAISVNLVACATSSTGRDQLLLYPPQQMDQMGAVSFASLKERDESKISQDPAAIKYVNCIADALLEQLPEHQQSDWEVVVFDDDQVNAFALPGRKIGVYTGMINLAQNQHQLAAVMGHEIGHVLEQHSNERLSTQSLVNTGMQVTSAFMSEADPETRSAVITALGIGSQVGLVLPYSREHETEADTVGQVMMAKAGFKPHAAVELWEIMAQQGGSKPLEILSTHPSNQSRIQALEHGLLNTEGLYSQARANGLRPNCKKPN